MRQKPRSRHPHKDIEAAICYAESKGWRCKKAGPSGRAWGRLLCPHQERDGCSVPIWSTPRDQIEHAKIICYRVNSCRHINANQEMSPG